MTKLLRFAESASSNIVLYSRFIWLNGSITLIRAETGRYDICDIVHFSKGDHLVFDLGNRLFRSQMNEVRAKLPVNSDLGQDRITILLSHPPPPSPKLPPYFSPTHNSFFNTSDSYQFEISGRLKLVSVPFSSLVLYIGHLEKRFPESIMQSSEMGQSYYDSQSLHRPISYYFLVSFG